MKAVSLMFCVLTKNQIFFLFLNKIFSNLQTVLKLSEGSMFTKYD